MKGWGAILLVFGIGSFILPMIGIQFRLMSIMGGARPFIAVVLAIAGAVLLVLGFKADAAGAAESQGPGPKSKV